MLLSTLLACSLRLGSPERSLASVAPGEFVAASAEPGLKTALDHSLSRALAARGALDPAGGTPVGLEVLEASSAVLAAGSGSQVHQARLSLAVQLYGPRPRRVVLTAERSYVVVPGDSLGAASARAAAFEALADTLSEDAVTWILFAQGASP